MGTQDTISAPGLGEDIDFMVGEELRQLLTDWQGQAPSAEEWFTLHKTAVRRVTQRLGSD